MHTKKYNTTVAIIKIQQLLRENMKSYEHHFDGLVSDCSVSIANALEILQSSSKPSICSRFPIYKCQWEWIEEQIHPGTIISYSMFQYNMILLTLWETCNIAQKAWKTPQCLTMRVSRRCQLCVFNTLRPRQMDAISQTTFSNAF